MSSYKNQKTSQFKIILFAILFLQFFAIGCTKKKSIPKTETENSSSNSSANPPPAIVAGPSHSESSNQQNSGNENSTPSSTNLPSTISAQLTHFQGQLVTQSSLTFKTNNSQFSLSGNCDSLIYEKIKVIIDGSDTNQFLNCTNNTFSGIINSGLADNWSSPANNNQGYKIELLPSDGFNNGIPFGSPFSLFVLLKTTPVDNINFNEISYKQNGITTTQSLNNNGDNLTLNADYSSYSVSSGCNGSETEVALSGTYNPNTSDLPISISGASTINHVNSQFEFHICLAPGETRSIQIHHLDSFSNSSNTLTLTLNLPAPPSGNNLTQLIPGEIENAFVSQLTSFDFGNLVSGDYELTHVYSSTFSSEPQISSTGETGYTLDIGFNNSLVHY